MLDWLIKFGIKYNIDLDDLNFIIKNAKSLFFTNLNKDINENWLYKHTIELFEKKKRLIPPYRISFFKEIIPRMPPIMGKIQGMTAKPLIIPVINTEKSESFLSKFTLKLKKDNFNISQRQSPKKTKKTPNMP